MEIRAARINDWQQLRAIRLEALREEPDAYGSTLAEAALYTEAHWRDMAERNNYYLALSDGTAVGMAAGGPMPPKPDHLWLYGMYVTPGFRGSGIATQLVAQVANWIRSESVHLMGLHVTTTQHRAQSFYRRLGFVETGESEPMRRDERLTLVVMTTDLRVNRVI